MAHPYLSDRDELVTRLRKIEGQVRGVQRMVEADAYCIDVLTQISAIVSGMNKVGLRLLSGHVSGCVTDALADPAQRDDKVDELVKSIERFISS